MLAVNVINCFCVELLPQQHLASCAESYEVKGRLAKINTNGMNLHVDDPP
jgi:hypothetical protein